jgi:hypothetical protein
MQNRSEKLNEVTSGEVIPWEEFPTEPTPIIVSAEEYQWLCQQLEAPPRDLPRLRELLKRKPIWLEHGDLRDNRGRFTTPQTES